MTSGAKTKPSCPKEFFAKLYGDLESPSAGDSEKSDCPKSAISTPDPVLYKLPPNFVTQPAYAHAAFTAGLSAFRK